MRCPFCGDENSQVKETRETEEAIRRRRQCTACGSRYTTFERCEEVLPVVVKRDGRREPFSREKLERSLFVATQKRPVSVEDVEGLVDRVVRWAQERNGRELDSRTIGERVMGELAGVDPVAYIRFASVYLAFDDPDDFVREIARLRNIGMEEPTT
ncbi:MAG: transcriptional regulator NrdR [Alphaproteobacteria bacterium CG_4_10_14_0_2_um_filter_63_37]|nr:MAG: transcriptional regulator NrdR [Proteobacteria bacterium CG1_02_64_396]PJA25976.1 MAG: transcriptional regulator NrdR [Alphaproteobacteria bacterium CG_4_10_14_0_2_um_filter_63_37]